MKLAYIISEFEAGTSMKLACIISDFGHELVMCSSISDEAAAAAAAARLSHYIHYRE